MSKQGNSRNKGSILIVDNEYANLRKLTDMLEGEEYKVKGALDISSAFMLVEQAPPDLILLNIKLPGMNGFDICKELKSLGSHSDIPLLFLSTLENVDDLIAGFKAGGFDFISKPFHAEEVLARVSIHLNLVKLTQNQDKEVKNRTHHISEFDKHHGLMTYAVDNTTDRVSLIGPDGRFIYVNETGCQALGYTHEKLRTMRVSDVDKNFSQNDWCAHWEDLKNFGSKKLKTIHQDAKGQQQIIEIQSSYLNYQGEEYACSFGRDITENEELTKKLIEYREIIDNIGNPIALVGKDYIYRYINPSFQQVVNRPFDKIIGSSVADIFGTDIFDSKIRLHYENCFAGNFSNYQMWYGKHDLDTRLFDIRYYPFRDKRGSVIAVISNIIDITELYEAKSALEDSEARLQAFMDNLPANIYIKNENDVHIYVNKQTLNIMGMSEQEILGATTKDFFNPDTALKLVEIDKKILNQELPSQITEWSYGEGVNRKHLQDHKFLIPLKSGQKLLGGAAFDITELKEKERKLQAALAEINRLKEILENENITLREKIQVIHPHQTIVGKSEVLEACLREAQYVASENTTVLVLGETGTGKELLAQAIHNMSSRKHRVMVKVNCAALPANLIESELFGREKGAYTGAMTNQKGRFELAHASTIFLDEIGDLPLELQAKLLRVIQEGTFEMLGSNRTLKVDVRIIAATNRDLERLVKEGKFRKDLYYRVNVFPITVPPLKERRDDIPLLVWAFVDDFNKTMGKSVSKITDSDLEYLMATDWPGNVRELRNVIERSMILTKGPELHIRKSRDIPNDDEFDEPIYSGTLADVERGHILKTLENTGWRVSGKKGAAEILGLKPTTLEARMKKLGIVRPS